MSEKKTFWKRNFPTLSASVAFYLWGSLAPGNNLERLLDGNVLELLPHFNPVAFGIALGIAGLGLAVTAASGLRELQWARSRRSRSERARRPAAEPPRKPAVQTRRPKTDQAASMPPRPPQMARVREPSRVAPEPHRPASRPSRPPETGSGPLPPPQQPPHRRTQPDRPHRPRASGTAHGSAGRNEPSPARRSAPSRGTSQSTPAESASERRARTLTLFERCSPATHDGLTSVAVKEIGSGNVQVDYLGVRFQASATYAWKHLDEFADAVRKARVGFDLPTSFSLTRYLRQYPDQSPAEALSTYRDAFIASPLLGHEQGPTAPVRFKSLSVKGASWTPKAPTVLTWREIAAYTAIIRGARQGNPNLPKKITVEPVVGGPAASLDAALASLTNGR